MAEKIFHKDGSDYIANFPEGKLVTNRHGITFSDRQYNKGIGGKIETLTIQNGGVYFSSNENRNEPKHILNYEAILTQDNGQSITSREISKLIFGAVKAEDLRTELPQEPEEYVEPNEDFSKNETSSPLFDY
jgi:Zn/Cd-binding protein ZinT